MANSLNRREFVKVAGVAGLAAAAGCWTQDGDDAGMLGPVGGGSTATRVGNIIVASGWPAARDEAEAAPLRPLVAVTHAGNTFTWGEGRFVMSDIEVSVGEASSYAEARELVDRPPMIVVTTDGNQFTFFS